MKMTASLQRVLRAFLEDPAAARYGYDLMKVTGLQSGTLYPLLARLKDEGLADSRWEPPGEDGQRPRVYYQLTAEGVSRARLELAQLSLSRADIQAGVRHPVPGSAG